MLFHKDRKVSFNTRAEWCAMGDLESMLWMFQEFRSRLSSEYRALESEYVTDFSEENRKRINTYLLEHEDDWFYLQAAHMWLNRSALYGSKKAEVLLNEYPFYQMAAYFGNSFQLPGKNQHISCKGSIMRKMGFLDFNEKLSYDLESLNNNGIYTGSCYVAYDTPDETGFGMEDLDDYYFFDEFFQLLYVLRGWSTRDIRNNEEQIRCVCAEKRAKKQKERDSFWIFGKKTGMEKYHLLAYDIHGPMISEGIVLTYQQNLKLPNNRLEHVIIPEGVIKIAPAAFANCEKIASVKLPESVTEIGEYAFSGCNNLKSFHWPATVTSVPAGAFFHCHGLEEVILPNTLTEIQEGAFLGCKSLKKIIIPNSVTKIGDKVFLYCESLEKITAP